MTGDVTDDAIYNRNRIVEERFNVKINTAIPTDDLYSWHNTVANTVLAGDNVYDVCGHYAYQLYQAANKGIYQDWNQINYIDQSRPWWISDINENATINGKLFGLTGYLGVSLLQYTYAMFFNTRYIEDYGYKADDLYQTVYDGGWTFDAFQNIVKDMYSDLNGDGNFDDGDFYGYCSASGTSLDLWQAAFDIPISGRANDGGIAINIVTNKRIDALEKLNSFYSLNEGTRIIKTDATVTPWLWYEQYNFSVGKQAFVASIFLAAYDLYRDMSDSYGILPLPKYDDSQDEYLTNINDRYTIWGVPMTVSDTDFVGMIVEALACETYRSVYPAFYDVALKSKFSSDEDTANMVDIVMNGARFDFSYMFGEYLQSAPYMFRQLIQKGSNDLASTYAEKESAIQNGLTEIYSYYE